jgi:hypothetical protein
MLNEDNSIVIIILKVEMEVNIDVPLLLKYHKGILYYQRNRVGVHCCCCCSFVSRESIDSTLAAYNNSCAEMRSEARDSYIRFNLETI